MSLLYLESSTLAFCLIRLSKLPFLGYLGTPFIGKQGALGQPKGSGGVFGRKKPLPERVKETWQLLLHGGPYQPLGKVEVVR